MKRTILTIGLLLLIAFGPAFGSLTFTNGSTSTRVEFGSAANLDNLNPETFCVWAYPTATPAATRTIMNKGGGGNANNLAITATILEFTRGFTTTDATAGATFANTNWTNDTWNFLCATWDGTNAPTLWTGTRTISVTAVSTYSAHTANSGTILSDAANTLKVGGFSGVAQGFPGVIGWAGVWGADLGSTVINQQYCPHVTAGNVLFVWLGFNGVSTQTDWSGLLNNGTVTGATQSATPPIPTKCGN